MADSKPTTRLQQLIQRTDRVLAVMHAPSAAHARLMEMAGQRRPSWVPAGWSGPIPGWHRRGYLDVRLRLPPWGELVSQIRRACARLGSPADR